MSSEAPASDNRAAEEKIPRPFGRLWLLRRLARGGMGEVFLAANKGIEGAERPCVVKIIRRDHIHDRSFLARFLDEARVQAQLAHPGVAQIVEAAMDEEGEPYVVVEYVEGRSLGEVRTRAAQLGFRIAWPDAVAMAAAAAEALGHVHERTDSAGHPLGIVHRDLSPQNVMVAYAGDLKLIDFGTARAQNRRCQTISGVVFAKPGYVAPEVANGISGDFRVDLYALGIMFWELLAGRRFLQGDTNEHLAAVAKGALRPPPIAALVGAPVELDHVIARLVDHDRDARYPSTPRAVSDLMKLLSRAPSLPNGERGVRARIAQLMYRLYPAEPARSRGEFGALLKNARATLETETREPKPARESEPAPSPAPADKEAAKAEPSRAGPPEKSVEEGCFWHDPDALPGTRYRILRTIGEGAMGIVYEALHLDLMRPVALKVLSAEHSTSRQYATSFRKEARAIARVSHPNLVVIHDFGQSSDGRLYCAMELLDGETLDRRLAREGAMDWEEAVGLGIAACRGLEAAHAAGVCHRDLKPANILVPRAPARAGAHPVAAVKLLDFGIAKAKGDAPDGAPARLRTDFRITGTPEYMAPEQAGSSSVDGRADIYALGCVLYELCTGRLPFAATSAVDAIEQKSKGSPEPMRVRARALDLPPLLDRVVLRAMAPRPTDRYAGAAEFRRELERVLMVPRRRRVASRAFGYAAIGAASLFALGVFASRRAHMGMHPAGVSEMAPSLLAMSLAPLAERHATAGDDEMPEGIAIGREAAIPPPTATIAETPFPPPRPAASVRLARKEAAPLAPLPFFPPSPAPPSPPAPLMSARLSPPLSPPLSSPPPLVPSESAPARAVAEPLEARLAKGDEQLRAGNRETALAWFRDLAKDYPTNVRVLRRWADAAAAMHRWEETEDAVEQWMLFDAGAEPKLYLARVLGYRGRPAAAAAVLNDLLEAHPECDEARALLHDYGSPAGLPPSPALGQGRAAQSDVPR